MRNKLPLSFVVRHSLLILYLVGIVMAIALALGSRPYVAWAADSIPLDEYWRRIDAVADLLEDVEADGATIAVATEELATVEAVELPDGQVLPVDNEDLLAILRRDDIGPKDLAGVRARLEALRRAKEVWIVSDRPVLETDQTFSQLEEILSRSEFAQVEERPARKSIFQEALEWLGKRLTRWLGRVGSMSGMEPLFTLLGVAVVLAVLGYAFRGAWGQWVTEGSSRGSGAADDEAGLSSNEALARAQIQAEAGDYRQAVRYLYLSTLLWLDERRLLRYDAALTNSEFLRQVDAGLRTTLFPVVDLFDRVWYGFAPLDSHGYAVYIRQVEQVRQVREAE